MNGEKASQLFQKLQGTSIHGWTVDKLINNGKSAAVFEAHQGKTVGALKIFDQALIDRFGGDKQIARIERELELIGQVHPSMVKILDGGVDKVARQYFIVMEYLAGPNIKECLSDIPLENIPVLIEQLASAANFLEQRNLVHRDIKPENIVLLENFTKVKLLDFGVIRPIGQPGVTDDDGIQNFVGTLQYSSPEFLLRIEKDNLDGWRALTFYQIGGVLHDLIMRKALFEEYCVPYSRLVNAVQSSPPIIQNSAVDNRLVDLAKSCLLKNPLRRLDLVSWESFSSKRPGGGTSAKQRVTNKANLLAAEKIGPMELTLRNPDVVIDNVIDILKISIVRIERENEFFPQVEYYSRVKFQSKFQIKLSLQIPVLAETIICIHVTPIESEVDAVSLWSSAHELSAEQFHNDESDNFFRGPVDAGEIHKLFEDCLFRRIEALS